jgi:hypothetical protein
VVLEAWAENIYEIGKLRGRGPGSKEEDDTTSLTTLNYEFEWSKTPYDSKMQFTIRDPQKENAEKTNTNTLAAAEGPPTKKIRNLYVEAEKWKATLRAEEEKKTLVKKMISDKQKKRDNNRKSIHKSSNPEIDTLHKEKIGSSTTAAFTIPSDDEEDKNRLHFLLISRRNLLQ